MTETMIVGTVRPVEARRVLGVGAAGLDALVQSGRLTPVRVTACGHQRVHRWFAADDVAHLAHALRLERLQARERRAEAARQRAEQRAERAERRRSRDTQAALFPGTGPVHVSRTAVLKDLQAAIERQTMVIAHLETQIDRVVTQLADVWDAVRGRVATGTDDATPRPHAT